MIMNLFQLIVPYYEIMNNLNHFCTLFFIHIVMMYAFKNKAFVGLGSCDKV